MKQATVPELLPWVADAGTLPGHLAIRSIGGSAHVVRDNTRNAVAYVDSNRIDGEANARLIAAAPAMLAALEAVEREFQYHEGPSWLAAARAAIREARGEAVQG